jgi:hypothetical protein
MLEGMGLYPGGFQVSKACRKTFPRKSAELQIPPQQAGQVGSPGFPVESCGFGQLHVVLFKENHISGAGESCEVGNPGTLLMNKRRVVSHLRRSTACLWTQPFRTGLIFGAGPLGLDCKHRFPMFIPPLTCRRQVGCSYGTPHGTPGQAGQSG